MKYISSNSSELNNYKRAEVSPVKPEEKEDEEVEEDDETEEVESETTTVGETKKRDSNDIVTTCVIVALSIAVGALGAVVLMNKKQNNKEENKTEHKE